MDGIIEFNEFIMSKLWIRSFILRYKFRSYDICYIITGKYLLVNCWEII